MKSWPLVIVLSASLLGCGGAKTGPELASGDQGVKADSQAASADQHSAPASTHTQTAELSDKATPAVPTLSYEALLKAADDAFAAKDAKKSLQLLTQAIQQSPQQIDAYLRRATLLADAQFLPQAINDLTSALQLKPQDAKLFNSRGYFRLMLQQYELAIEDFSDAIGLQLSYAQPYNNRGLCMLALARAEEAVLDFDNAIRAKPDYADAHNNRGYALMQMSENEQALTSLNKALEINPNYVNALSNRGRCLISLERFEDAAKDFTTAIQVQPEQILHFSNRAEAFAKAGQKEQALKDEQMVDWLQKMTAVNQRIARNLRDIDAWIQRGQLLVEHDKIEEADRAFNNASAIDTKNVPALIALATFSLNQKNFDKAIEGFSQALAVEPQLAIYSQRGDAYFAAGQFSEAIDDYTAGRRFDAQVVLAYEQRAAAAEKAGDAEKAKADRLTAQQLQQQLTLSDAQLKPQGKPRVMVIEQVSHEEPAKE